MNTDDLIARLKGIEAKRIEVRQGFVRALNNQRHDEAAKLEREADKLYHESLEIKADLARRGIYP